MHHDDTIAATASAPGGALRGIVRLSGPSALDCVQRLFAPAAESDLRAIVLPSCFRGELRLPRDLGSVPATLYLWPTERSYTRQPSAELHLPGSPPLVAAALEAVCDAGARLAGPGEFTLRAFLAGRLDLTQAEAVLGVIDAATDAELKVALAQLAGGLARPLFALRERLLDLLAHLEAGLDFVDEDVEFITAEHLEAQLASAAIEVEQIAERMHSRGEARSLPRIVLVGLPNVGKSSLLNALAEGAAAIVSETAGTTRDYVARRVSIAGRECLLVDTAGLDSATAPGGIAAAAQAASLAQQRQSDVALLCFDASRPLDHSESEQLRTSSERRLVVWTKCDLAPSVAAPQLNDVIQTSSRTGQGIDVLRQAIASTLDRQPSDSVVAGTADRCRQSLRRASEALQRAWQAAAATLGEELVASEVRLALDELGQVVGTVYTDDVLDRVFSRFCIGK